MKPLHLFPSLFLVLHLQTSFVFSQNLANLTLLAHYPLSSTANDTTGNYGPMELTNTPFRDGGIYCNGNYIWNEPDSCNAVTPSIDHLDLNNFAVSAMFKADSITSKRRPVIVCGRFNKWCSLFIDPDSTIGLAQGGAFHGIASSGVHYASNTWHQIIFTFDSTEGMGRLYLDGVAVDSSKTDLDHRNDKAFSITNGSVSRTFKGCLKDLKVYSLITPLTDFQKDSLALVALYNNTNGVDWTNNENWLTGAVSTWHGITVSVNRVTQIDLNNNNLSGTIPFELSHLTNLSYLRLNNNQLSGSILSQIGNLLKLSQLYLDHNQLTGSVPIELYNLTNLMDLYLNDNQLSGVLQSEIGNLINLTMLYLMNNQFTGPLPSEILNCNKLEHFNLNNNDLVDLPDLTPITSLKYVFIENNKFTFEDIEPNIGDFKLYYSIQDSVGEAHDTTISEGENLTLSVTVGGTTNQYQWFHDGVKIEGAEDSLYTIDTVIPSDSGAYTCQITNTIATDLTLYSHPINVHVTSSTGLSNQLITAPEKFALLQNHPNPFNPETIIQYHVAKSCDVVLKIYNVTGQEIATIVNDYQNQGKYEVNFNLEEIPSGIYFYKIQMKDFTQVKKMIKIE